MFYRLLQVRSSNASNEDNVIVLLNPSMVGNILWPIEFNITIMLLKFCKLNASLLLYFDRVMRYNL